METREPFVFTWQDRLVEFHLSETDQDKRDDLFLSVVETSDPSETVEELKSDLAALAEAKGYELREFVDGSDPSGKRISIEMAAR